MKVADFFCGAGGFSEGFRQAGFEIAFAVDRWQPAIDTYKANKPNCTVIKDDIIRISALPDEEFHALIPDTEIIIGSPPCVAFSSSNKSGKGDKSMGIKLLKAYLRIVARKKFMPNSQLRYWILENVPNIQKYIEKEYAAADLGLPGDFTLHVINESTGVYNAKYFGAPTNRQRFLCGEFPIPVKTHTDSNVVTMRTVLESLGEPLCKTRETISDCNYPGFKMEIGDVTDHQYLCLLEPFEWETAKRLSIYDSENELVASTVTVIDQHNAFVEFTGLSLIPGAYRLTATATIEGNEFTANNYFIAADPDTKTLLVSGDRLIFITISESGDLMADTATVSLSGSNDILQEMGYVAVLADIGSDIQINGKTYTKPFYSRIILVQ